MPDEATEPRHIFTVDVEEYFQVFAFRDTVSRAEWDIFPDRVERCVDRLLSLLEVYGVRGTFFVLGWVADRHPALVRRVAEAGHEVASHGWSHRPVTELSREEFRTSVSRSKAVLEDVTGRFVMGYRAPGFSVLRGQEWALDVLLEEGYRYDSSHCLRQWKDGASTDLGDDPQLLERDAGSLLEVPISTPRIHGIRFPPTGGAYFRHLPYLLTSASLRAREREGVPGVFYIHPWELDPDQPRIPASTVARLRHYGGLRRTFPRLERLLEEFTFTSVVDWFGIGSDGSVSGEHWAAPVA